MPNHEDDEFVTFVAIANDVSAIAKGYRPFAILLAETRHGLAKPGIASQNSYSLANGADRAPGRLWILGQEEAAQPFEVANRRGRPD